MADGLLQARRWDRPPGHEPAGASYDADIAATAPSQASVEEITAAARGRFPTLEGLRGLAALAVVAFHAGTFTGLTGPGGGEAGSWVRHLNVGVSVFFVLSAFLLYRPFVVAHLTSQRPPRVGAYAARRLVRIFPAYWLALTVSAYVLDHTYLGDAWGKFRFYALLQIYWGDTALGGLAQAWSLCTELSFYLFLPLWAAAVARVGGDSARRRRAHLAGCALLWVVGLTFRALLRDGDHALGYAWLPANTDLFALGMLLAVVSADTEVSGVKLQGLWRTLADLPAVGWLTALCVYATVVWSGFPFEFLETPTAVEEVGRQLLFGIIALLLIAPGALSRQVNGPVSRLLASRPLHALGVVSYGVYLWHLMVLAELDARWGPALGRPDVAGRTSWWALFLAGSAISVAVAAVSWFALERPLIDAVRRATGGRQRAPKGHRLA